MAIAFNKLVVVCVGGLLWRLQPDDKTEVIIVYPCHEDGAVEPQNVHMRVISVWHSEPLECREAQGGGRLHRGALWWEQADCSREGRSDIVCVLTCFEG